ncbi:hypothetical protein ANN_02612, partial [Periplaneta americana]
YCTSASPVVSHWPPRSPDLIPTQYFVWGAIKDVIYDTTVDDETYYGCSTPFLASSRELLKLTYLDAWVDITARLEKPTYYGRNDHDFKIKCRKQKTDVGKFSFLNRTINDWNDLPAAVFEGCPSLRRFKNNLKSCLNQSRTHRHDTTVHDVIRLLIPALYKNQSDSLMAADGDCHHLCKLMAPVRHRWSINDVIGGIRNTVMPSDCSPMRFGIRS